MSKMSQFIVEVAKATKIWLVQILHHIVYIIYEISWYPKWYQIWYQKIGNWLKITINKKIAKSLVKFSSLATLYKNKKRVEPFKMVPKAGLEPAWDCSRGILSPLRLPIPPFRQFGGTTQIRTGDEGFADLCLTTWLWCHITYLRYQILSNLSTLLWTFNFKCFKSLF